MVFFFSICQHHPQLSKIYKLTWKRSNVKKTHNTVELTVAKKQLCYPELNSPPFLVYYLTGIINQSRMLLLVDWLLAKHPSNMLRVAQRWICPDNCACSHTETEAADPTFYLTQSQYTCPGRQPVPTLTL